MVTYGILPIIYIYIIYNEKDTLLHLCDYVKKLSIQINVATDKGNSRNEMWHWTSSETVGMSPKNIFVFQPEIQRNHYVGQSVFPQLLGEWQTCRDQNLLKAHH